MQRKKIIICKFNLKNKCQFGEKCKFQHLSIDALNEILNKFEDIKQENVSLKRNLKEKLKIISNLNKESCDVTKNNVKDLDKPLYNSFFKEISKDQSKSKIKLVQKRKNNDKVEREDINLYENSESMYQLLTKNKHEIKFDDRKHDEIEKRLNFLENQRLIDLENLKNETENIRKRIDEIIKSGTKKQEEIKSMEKRIVVNEQNQKDELEKFNNEQFKVFEKVISNNMIAFEWILKENGILDKDKKFKSLKEMINSNEKMETNR
jgi:hypothetical protein